MIEIITQLPVGFVIALSGILIPGPMLAYIIMKTPSYGPRTGTFTALGHIFVEFGILALIALGFGLVLGSEFFQTAVGLVGGIMLLVLGLLYLSKLKIERELKSVVGIKHHPMLGGVLFSTVFNPSVPLWWATVGMATLMKATLAASLVGAVCWVVGHFLADLGWFSLVSYFVARGRQVIGTRAYRGLLATCGGVLLVFGAYFIAEVVIKVGLVAI